MVLNANKIHLIEPLINQIARFKKINFLSNLRLDQSLCIEKNVLRISLKSQKYDN